MASLSCCLYTKSVSTGRSLSMVSRLAGDWQTI